MLLVFLQPLINFNSNVRFSALGLNGVNASTVTPVNPILIENTNSVLRISSGVRDQTTLGTYNVDGTGANTSIKLYCSNFNAVGFTGSIYNLTTSNGEHIFTNNGNTLVTIHENGNVGIGVTNPTNALEINGTLSNELNITGTLTTANIYSNVNINLSSTTSTRSSNIGLYSSVTAIGQQTFTNPYAFVIPSSNIISSVGATTTFALGVSANYSALLLSSSNAAAQWITTTSGFQLSFWNNYGSIVAPTYNQQFVLNNYNTGKPGPGQSGITSANNGYVAIPREPLAITNTINIGRTSNAYFDTNGTSNNQFIGLSVLYPTPTAYTEMQLGQSNLNLNSWFMFHLSSVANGFAFAAYGIK